MITSNTATHQPTVSGPSVGTSWTPAVWAATVLALAGLPVTSNNVNNITHWMPAEEPTGNWWNTNDPLNAAHPTTSPSGKIGTSLYTGAALTAKFLRQTNMAGIYHALAQTATIHTFSAAVVASPWAAGHYGGTPDALAHTVSAPTVAAPSTTGNPTAILTSAIGGGATTKTAGFWTKVETILGHLPTPTNPLPYGAGGVAGHALGLTGISTNLTTIARDIGYLHDLSFWKRVGIFLGGGALLGVGIFLLAQQSPGVRKVESTAVTAAAV